MSHISLKIQRFAKFFILLLVFIGFASGSGHAQNVQEGGAIYKQKCTSCHALDRVVLGPALKGVTERRSEEWLIKWIKNSQALIAAGDKDAVALYNEWNQVAMTPFPELSDDDVRNILAFIKTEGDKPATPENSSVGDASEGGAGGGVTNFMLIGLIAVVLIAFFVIVVLNRVINTLEKLIMKKQGLEVAEEPAAAPADRMAGLKRLARNKKFIFFVVLLVVIFLGSAGWMGMWNTGVHEGYQPVQPIKFSHQLHAGINKIDCQYCHSPAYKSKNASIPSANVCMNCHNYVTAADKYNGEVSPEIQKIYKALDYDPETKKYGPNQKPIEWIRIHNLPDLAYFNHSQHVTVAGIECQKCHGPIQTMEEVYQYSPLTMKWCVNCHRETEVNHKDNGYYDKLIAAHEKLKKGEKFTAAAMGGLECGKCHY